MASCKTDDLKKFQDGGEFPISVRYLGRGPDSGTIPDHILERRNPIPGKLTFSKKRVSFYCEHYVINDPDGDHTHKPKFIGVFSDDDVNFNYPMYLVKCENLSEDNKILYLVLHPSVSKQNKRRIYFDVADPKNENCAVYYPQWVEVARSVNKDDITYRAVNKTSEFLNKIKR